jgi:cytochrome c556
MKASLLALVGILTFGAANAADKAPATAGAPNLHELMKAIVAPETQIVWDVGNNAQDADGNPDASKLKAGDWSKLIAASNKVKQAAQALAQADHILAASPGVKLDGEGNPGTYGVKQVQTAIDKNPAAFKAFAQALVVNMDQVLAAAQAKNAQKLFDSSGGLDQVCENCHVQFWYPEEKTPR